MPEAEFQIIRGIRVLRPVLRLAICRCDGWSYSWRCDDCRVNCLFILGFVQKNRSFIQPVVEIDHVEHGYIGPT